MTAAIERLSIPVPAEFDPSRHAEAILKQVISKRGTGWKIDTFDPDRRTLSLSRTAALTHVRDKNPDTKTIGLGGIPKLSDGDKLAAQLADEYPGFHMTRFDPFLAQAEMAKLSDDEVRCRGAVAVALGCKPWDVTVKARRDGGFDLGLPKSYQPSRHQPKLEEVATGVVGRDGWYVTIDAKALTASIIPSDPPTFPETLPFPLKRLGKGNVDQVPFGMELPHPGHDFGNEIVIDWTASAFSLIAGTPGSGKSVLLSAIVADALANGSELVIVDDVSKAIDFNWCKQYCRPGGWGSDSLEGAVAALGLVLEEGGRRAKKLKESGYVNWLDMPKKERFTPILVIVDEISALVVPDPVPKGIPKDHPLFVEIAERNLARAMIQSYLRKILATLRFVGVRAVLASQATNQNTGIDPGMRTLIGHKILQGVNPSRAARGQIFADETAVPVVPDNVKSGGKRARGVGVATLEAQAPAVYKTYFATTDDYAAALQRLGVPTRPSPAPTSSQIDKFLPSLDDGKKDDGPAAPAGGGGAGLPDDDPRKGLSGFELANMNRHMAAGGGPTRKQKVEAREEAGWAKQSGPVQTAVMDKCDSCDSWIRPDVGCRCQN